MTEILANSNAVFLLVTFGLYGLIYEFFTPGAFLPGITGAILLLTGLFALNSMAVNYLGILFMILGLGAMTAEGFFRTRGMLALCGAVSFAAGSTFFISGVSHWLIGGMTLASVGIIAWGSKVALRTRNRAVTTGVEGLRHSTGEIVSWAQSKGEVLAAGSVWKARSKAEYILKKGDRVKVADVDGLCLIIEPASHQ